MPGVGHSVLTSDFSGCAVKGTVAFLRGRDGRQVLAHLDRGARSRALSAPVRARVDRRPAPDRRSPASRAARSRRSRVTLAGLGYDAAFVASSTRLPGLRAGYVQASRSKLELHGVEWIRGVRVSGTLNPRGAGTLTVSGPAAAPGHAHVLVTLDVIDDTPAPLKSGRPPWRGRCPDLLAAERHDLSRPSRDDREAARQIANSVDLPSGAPLSARSRSVEKSKRKYWQRPALQRSYTATGLPSGPRSRRAGGPRRRPPRGGAVLQRHESPIAPEPASVRATDRRRRRARRATSSKVRSTASAACAGAATTGTSSRVTASERSPARP